MDREDKEYIDAGLLGYEKSLNESHEDILSVVEKEIGVSDRPIDGPSYIMPNGKFLTIWRSKIPVSKYSATGSATHRDVQDFLYSKGLVKDKGIDVDDHDLEKLGCIRVNSGFEEYIWLPDDRPNETQWQSLLVWLDWYFRFHSKLMVGYHHYAPKTYYAKDYTTDEILKKCKEAYARGYLTESKQDLEKFRQWAGDELANKFFKLKDRLSGRQKDIYYWIGLEKELLKNQGLYHTSDAKDVDFAHKRAIEALKWTLEEIEQEPSKSQVKRHGKEGAKKIYEDENWLVYDIQNYEASVLYGKHTSWCVTGNNSDQGKIDYDMHTNCAKLIFYIPKKGSKSYKHGKYALEFESMNSWLLYNDADFVEVGVGGLWEGRGGLNQDIWIPEDNGGVHPDFPYIKGLPDLNKRYEEVAKELGWDKPIILEKIVKKGNKWQVQSENGKNLGIYDTKEEAEDRLKQVHYFKHMNKDKYI